MLNKLISVIQQ